MRILFFDTETTGNTPQDRIVQLAIKERGVQKPILNELFKPSFPIPFEASAVHHISNKMVANKPAFKDSPRYKEIKDLFEDLDTIVVAHNSAFDVAMLEAEDIHPTNVICTYKNIRTLDTNGDFSKKRLGFRLRIQKILYIIYRKMAAIELLSEIYFIMMFIKRFGRSLVMIA
jgi:DNA polymerase III epsilon subunit-like protein